jgi:hypothetical protein
MLGVTVPPGVRPPAFPAHFETIETRVPVETVQEVPAVETPQDRHDIAVIGPIAALVLALTISTLILEHPAARAVAAGLATVGLIAAVTLMLLNKRPERGRHVARHRMDESG